MRGGAHCYLPFFVWALLAWALPLHAPAQALDATPVSSSVTLRVAQEDPTNSAVSDDTQPAAMLVRIRKAARTLELWSGDQRMAVLPDLQFGPNPVGPKQFEGDGRTPEGRYIIDWRNPNSAYHLSLHISYPNAEQVTAARRQGRSAGGMIMIHGQPNGHEERVDGDWTEGCIAVSNAEIEMLWHLVPDGAEVEILP